MIWLLWFNIAGAAWFLAGLLADHMPGLPPVLTPRHRTTSGDN